MRFYILFILSLITINLCFSQDTIFFKDGKKIPSRIVEKTDSEIKYKKFTKSESIGIYSALIIDIKKIKYEDGKIEDYSCSERDLLNSIGKELIPSNSFRFAFGVNHTYFLRNRSDNLIDFWRYWNDDNTLEIGGNKRFTEVYFNFGAPLGGSKRNWFGGMSQVIISPKDAIYAKNEFYGQNEIKLSIICLNTNMYYGHSINFKKNLVAVFEAGLDVGFMSGNIIFYNETYKISGTKLSGHFAPGVDWIISKRILLNTRIGYRLMKIDEWHESEKSESGYTRFYGNPPYNDELVYVNWGGIYFSAGLSYALYKKI